MKIPAHGTGGIEMKRHELNKTDKTGRIVFLGCVFLMFTMLFYFQLIRFRGAYISDVLAHVGFAIAGKGYSLFYAAIALLYRITHRKEVMVLLESAMMVFAFLVTEKHLKRIFSNDHRIATFLSVCLLFLCSPYIPYIYPHFYKEGLITQPWHNCTYIAMRPFALLAYFSTMDILEIYRERFTGKNWISIALPLLIGASIKPNFLITYCFTLLFVLIVDFVKDIMQRKLNISRFTKYILLGSVVFPSLAVLFVQSIILYAPTQTPEAQSGIAFVFLSSSFFSAGMLLTLIKLLRDLTFPILVWIYAGKSFTKTDKIAYLQFFITLLIVICMKETGPRENHGNFYWGIYMSSYILFMVSFSKFIKHLLEKKWVEKSTREKWYACIGTILLVWHVLSGVVYFGMLLLGTKYMI